MSTPAHESDDQDFTNAPVPMTIDGELDLHTFRPKDVKDLLIDYLAACREKGIFRVRVVHGKGIGALRTTVHAALAKHPEVTDYHLAPEHAGGWGATIVHLKPTEPMEPT